MGPPDPPLQTRNQLQGSLVLAPMRIREDNRNMFLLTTVTLCCAVVAGALAVLEPVFGEAPEKQVADSKPVENSAQAQVRVVGGAPFVPNVNPRQH